MLLAGSLANAAGPLLRGRRSGRSSGSQLILSLLFKTEVVLTRGDYILKMQWRNTFLLLHHSSFFKSRTLTHTPHNHSHEKHNNKKNVENKHHYLDDEDATVRNKKIKPAVLGACACVRVCVCVCELSSARPPTAL